MIRSCLLQYDYSFKSENNGCSVYMNNTFNGHASNVNGLLNLDRSDMFIILMPKDAKLTMIVPHTCGTAAKGHIGVKRMKKLHADGSLDSLDFESLEPCRPCPKAR